MSEHDTASHFPSVNDGRGVRTGRRGSRIWLFGAYTFLLAWSAAFLVLFFTNRLPV